MARKRGTTMGRKLRQLREARQWTLQDVAKRVGAREAQVSTWELDKVMPQLQYLVKLADLFEVSFDDLGVDLEKIMGVPFSDVVRLSARKNSAKG